MSIQLRPSSKNHERRPRLIDTPFGECCGGRVLHHDSIGAEGVSEIADLVRVPDGFAAWWLADLAARGVVDPLL